MKWQEVTIDFMNNGVISGEEMLGYNPDWEDEDFNPGGFRVCFYDSFRGWVSTRYDGDQDSYVTEEGDDPMWVYPLASIGVPPGLIDDIDSLI
jgi:hypothetical protein